MLTKEGGRRAHRSGDAAPRHSFKNGVLQNDLRPWAETVIPSPTRNQYRPISMQRATPPVAAMGTVEGRDTLAEPPPAPLPEG